LRHVGLFEERYREMRGYSTGMRQRVKLAQALVHDPQLSCSTSRQRPRPGRT
jgi:ABC-2 type transport system ATP-binding protein